MASRPEDLQATFCATLVDEWARCGVEHAVISPGSRSTPLALALVADPRVRVHVHLDERSAGFFAIGLARAGGEPAVVVTTSGTAAVEVHPAVVEADLAGVPLLVCTANRPPELIDVGAPQAIDQTHLYGRAPRWFHAPGVADERATAWWRPLAARAYGEATGVRPGPVHLDLAFREPLVGQPGPLPPGRGADDAAWSWRPPASGQGHAVLRAAGDLAGRRGVVLAGAGSGDGPTLHAIADALGWPVVAAPQAPVWREAGATIRAADALLRVPAPRATLRPEVVLRLGGPLASRVVGEWAAGSGASEIVAAGSGRWIDPYGTAAVVLPDEPDQLLDAWSAELGALRPVDDGGWLRSWQEAGAAAQAAVEVVLSRSSGLTEPGIARALVDALPESSHLVVSSSMPVRDLESYVPPRPLEVHANRGANGIDGVVSTAVGVAAASGSPTALLIGDLAFLHDSNGLLGASRRGIDLVVVVVDNDGGGIFSLLPQASAVAPEVFELVYGTPHGLDIVAVASALGAHARAVEEIGPAVEAALAAGGVHVLVARTDRSANAELHARIIADVAAVLSP